MTAPLFSSPLCFNAAPLINSQTLFISGLFLAVSFVFLLLLKKRRLSTKLKIGFIYAHIMFLLLPIFTLTTQTACGVLCLSCANHLLTVLLYALPPTLFFSGIFGFVALPTLFIHSSKKMVITHTKTTLFVHTIAKKLHVRAPTLYAFDTQAPVAFSFRSFRSAVFLSVGLLELLNRKELEAVLIHEIAHLKQRSSILKFSYHLIKLFSPFSLIAKIELENTQDEKDADRVVLQIQKTEIYLKSVRCKMRNYHGN